MRRLRPLSVAAVTQARDSVWGLHGQRGRDATEAEAMQWQGMSKRPPRAAAWRHGYHAVSETIPQGRMGRDTRFDANEPDQRDFCTYGKGECIFADEIQWPVGKNKKRETTASAKAVDRAPPE